MRDVEIQLAAERLYVIEERLGADEVQQKAMDRRVQAFGGGLGSLLQRPKADDIVLVARQHRLEPIWHVACSARYVYERSRQYSVPAGSPEVEALTIDGRRYELSGGHGARVLTLETVEHCRDEFHNEILTDGITGASVTDVAAVMDAPRMEVADLDALGGDGTIVVPPEQRASFVVRTALAEMMKPVQADKIFEESIVLEATDLYYRPVWAFEFAWPAKGKQGVVEIDVISGQARPGKPLIGQIRGMVTRDLLFDVGADTVGLLIPGGSIAVRLAQAAIDKK